MKAVFVVGTGRSGTHFTVRLLNGFANSHDPLGGNENPKILQDVASSAIHHRIPSRTTSDYYWDRLRVSEGIFLDQHHPNLFFVQHWAAMFDGIVFIYPKRPAHQIVASMLRHDGVMSWYRYAENWRQRWFNRVPYPNRFLGLARADEISALPMHLLCAHRVIAHEQAYRTALAEGGADLRSVEYKALLDDPLAEFSRVFRKSELRELGSFTLAETPNRSSLAKYREVLDDKQVAEINALENQLSAHVPQWCKTTRSY
jgi:hypothetical protein